MLNIAVVGYNYELSCEAIRLLADNDVNNNINTVICRKDLIEMNDRTRYKAFPTYNHARENIIDQVIIVDDNRWNVYQQQFELINWLKYRMECTSCVPEEFQIQKYEY